MLDTGNILLSRVVQVEGNIVSDMGGEKVMMNIQQGKYYNLGETGGAIWELIKTPITIQELVGKLLSEFEVDQYECEKQVLSFLENLKNEGLVKVLD
jgi:Coenzyme PQQ synthesis protein D (PqqD)